MKDLIIQRALRLEFCISLLKVLKNMNIDRQGSKRSGKAVSPCMELCVTEQGLLQPVDSGKAITVSGAPSLSPFIFCREFHIRFHILEFYITDTRHSQQISICILQNHRYRYMNVSCGRVGIMDPRAYESF